MHTSAEECLLLGDKLGSAEVAHKGTGLRGADDVDRDRHPDDQDAGELEEMAEPPAEIHVVQKQRRRKGGAQPGNADDDGEIGAPAGQEVRLQRAEHEDREEEGADREHERRGRARRRRNGRHDVRKRHADDAETDHADHGDRVENE